MIAERFKRIDKVTVLASIAMLFITYYIVAKVVPFIIYFLDMLGVGNSDIYRWIIITRDYIVIPFILLYYIISIVFGYWDLKWLHIIRMKDKPNKYVKIAEETIEGLTEFEIYSKKGIKKIGINEIEKEWKEDSDSTYIKIKDYYTIFKDIHIDLSGELTDKNILVKVETYQYIGKRLLYNKNLYCYRFSIRLK